MPEQNPSPRPLIVLRSRGLRGRFKVPAEPSLLSLALLLGAVARGETVIYTDTQPAERNLAATVALLQSTGVRVELADDRWHVHGLGALGLLEPAQPVDFAGAAQALPLAMGLVAPYGFASRFDGDTTMQPPGPLLEALRAMGVEVREQRTGRLPLTLRGPRTGVPFVWQLPTASAGTKAALLLAALALPGVSALSEPLATPDHAERLLRHFGAEVIESTTEDGRHGIEVTGLPGLGARTLAIGGDPDLAAFVIVAALVVPDSEVLIENLLLHPARRAVLAALEEMGGDIEVVERRQAAGEEVADLRVRHSALLGIPVDSLGLTAAGVPPVAIAAAFAAGETRIPRLGIDGEAALYAALATGLAANGAAASADRNGLLVGRPAPGTKAGGALVDTLDDPYLAAAFIVFGLAAPEQVTLADETALHGRFPGLTGSLEGLGAQFYRRWAA